MKFLSFFIILLFSFINVFSNQPMEPISSPNPNNRGRQSKKIYVEREKKPDGTESKIFKIGDLSQFLILSTLQSKPFVIMVYSGKSREDLKGFMQFAYEFNEDVAFLSVDAEVCITLVKLFNSLLQNDGVNLVENGQLKIPLFLFGEKDFVVLQNNMVSFKKGGLKLVGTPGFLTKNDLLDNFKKALKGEYKKPLFAPNEDSEPQENAEKGYFERIKGWFKSKFVSLLNN